MKSFLRAVNHSNKMANAIYNKRLLGELSLSGYPGPFINQDGESAVNAFSILDQMPGATIGKLSNGDWACSWNLPNNYRDFRQDECPHKAAALAFIAWKKGLEA